jgi:hypothetical protein
MYNSNTNINKKSPPREGRASFKGGCQLRDVTLNRTRDRMSDITHLKAELVRQWLATVPQTLLQVLL